MVHVDADILRLPLSLAGVAQEAAAPAIARAGDAYAWPAQALGRGRNQQCERHRVRSRGFRAGDPEGHAGYPCLAPARSVAPRAALPPRADDRLPARYMGE